MAYALPDEDPFDPALPDYAPETLSLEEIIDARCHALELGLRVALPCAVTALVGDQCVDIQPLFKTRFTGSPPEDMAQIKSVPVLMPRGAGYRLSYPLQVGDTGLALFADRNMDTFLGSSGQAPVDPADTRSHDISDAVFLPGLVPDGGQTTDTGRDVVLASGDVTLRLGPSGTLNIQNKSQEVLDLLLKALQLQADTLAAVAAAQALTAFGPAPLLASDIAKLQNLQTQAAALKKNLGTFQAGA